MTRFANMPDPAQVYIDVDIDMNRQIDISTYICIYVDSMVTCCANMPDPAQVCKSVGTCEYICMSVYMYHRCVQGVRIHIFDCMVPCTF